MYGLVFTDPNGATVFEVPVVDRPLTVGRANDVDIALPFKAVSRYHARFYSDVAGLYVEDLGSSNGVLVGGVRIGGPTALAPGMQVRIGIINVTVGGQGAATEAGGPAALDDVPTDPRLGPGGEAQPMQPAAYSPAPEGMPPVGPSPFPMGAQPPPVADPFAAAAPDAGTLDLSNPFAAPQGQQAAQHAPPAMDPAAQAYAAPAAIPPGAEPETSPEVPTMALPVQPRLVGTAGYLKDKVFFLDKAELTVGRVKGCTIVIEDASVSRNHAKIINKDETFVLFDLRSFNGTFVNDEKVTRQELEGGEEVRFGDIAFRFMLHDAPPEAGRKKKPLKPSRRRRLVLLASGAVVLLAMVIAGNILRNREQPPPPPDPQAEMRAKQAKVRQQLERGSAELRRRDWDSASATLQDVLKLDPLNEEAVVGLERAREERERGGWLEESKRVAEAGRDLDRAKRLLNKIPQKSTYYADARLSLRHLNRTIAEGSRNKGLSLCRAWRYEECQQELCRFFQTWPPGEPIPDEVRVRRALERAESKLRRRQRDEFVACEIPEPGTGDPAADSKIAGRYTDERIRGAVVAYYQGRADEGVRTLNTLEKARAYRDQRETISGLIEHMIRVQTASADLHRDVRGRALAEAERSFVTLKRADTQLVPAGLESRYRREGAKLLGDAYHEVGEGHMRGNRMREAYQAWAHGKSLAPAHPGILQSLLILESRAREACQTARERAAAGDQNGAASHFELCRDITPPSSPLHQGAAEGLRQVGR